MADDTNTTDKGATTTGQDMTYAATGVNYEEMDPFKRMCQNAARKTARNIERHGFTEVAQSRGESCFLIEAPDCYLAHVEEGLGTKNLVADAMALLTTADEVGYEDGCSYYDGVAQCTVAMIVNDMITLGALPLSVAMHLAVESSDWFKNYRRCQDLAHGWMEACNMSGCVWGAGETPALRDIIVPGASLLSGSAMGFIKPKSRLILPRIEAGDAIVILPSSGIHANGLTLCRDIAAKLPEGYLTLMPDGRTYGETILDPTRIYVPFLEQCMMVGVDIHYTANITGHGWRKLMRAPGNFLYRIDTLPDLPCIFSFLQIHGPISDDEAYANFNMGAGFALFVPERDMKKVDQVGRAMQEESGWSPLHAGWVHETSGEKSVAIMPKNLQYRGSTLQVR